MLSFRRVTLSALVLFMTFIVAPTVSFSQPQKRLAIIIEDFKTDELKCQLNSKDIEASISLIMRQNGIARDDTVISPYIYFNVTAIEISNINCAANVSISLIAYEPKINHSGFEKRNQIDEIRLCHDGGIFVYAKSKISKVIIDAAETLTKRCLSSIDY